MNDLKIDLWFKVFIIDVSTLNKSEGCEKSQHCCGVGIIKCLVKRLI
jgi:hypothetical protein